MSFHDCWLEGKLFITQHITGLTLVLVPNLNYLTDRLLPFRHFGPTNSAGRASSSARTCTEAASCSVLFFSLCDSGLVSSLLSHKVPKWTIITTWNPVWLFFLVFGQTCSKAYEINGRNYHKQIRRFHRTCWANAQPQISDSNMSFCLTHWLSGWPKPSPNCLSLLLKWSNPEKLKVQLRK